MALVIAELCQNHNGDRSILKKMIHEAAAAGADYAKIQSIHSDYLTHRPRFDEGLIENGVTKVIKRPYEPEYKRLKAMDIDMDTHRWFVDECDRVGIKSMTTVFARCTIPDLAKMSWNAMKIASYDCGSVPMLREMKQHFSPLFISTGATHEREIEQSAYTMGEHEYFFLHCVTIYPTPLDQLHLNRMSYLRRYTPKVGFSDHTLVKRDGIKASAVALLLGADVIERHFTVQAEDKTKDGPVSVNPGQLAEIVRLARADENERREYVSSEVGDYQYMLGQASRALSDEELLNRDYYRGRFASPRVDGTWLYNWEEK